MTWHVLTLLPYLAATVACVVLGIRRRLRIAESARLAAELDARPRGQGRAIAFKPFSVYLNGCKLGVATGHDLRFGANQTLLTVRQMVAGSAEHADRYPSSRFLRDAFVASSTVTVDVGPIDGDAITLGAMSVVSINYKTEYRTGETSLVAELSGPTVVDASKKLCTESQIAVQKAFVYPALTTQAESQ